MNTITQINAGNIKQLRAALQAKLDEFAKENGMAVSNFAIKYLDDSFTINKLVIGLANPNAEKQVDPRYKKDLERFGYRNGLTIEMIGKEVVIPSRQGLVKCKFLGMRASKAVFENQADGKPYLYNAETAAFYLKK